MNQTEVNLQRIRADDADVWRTINGAHMLINSNIRTGKGGIGSPLNGTK